MGTKSNNPIQAAISSGDLDQLREHLGAHPDQIQHTDHEGCTPLVAAARDGRLEAVQILVDNGADLEARDPEYRRTPLAWAAFHGHHEIVAYLLEQGANPHVKDAYGHTPRKTATMGEDGAWREWVSRAPHEFKAVADLLRDHEARSEGDFT